MDLVITQRSFVGQIEDTVVEMVFEQLEDERFGEQFVLHNEFVTYTDLIRQFGKRRVDQFIELAVEHAR
jgi:hypothetical protein